MVLVHWKGCKLTFGVVNALSAWPVSNLAIENAHLPPQSATQFLPDRQLSVDAFGTVMQMADLPLASEAHCRLACVVILMVYFSFR